MTYIVEFNKPPTVLVSELFNYFNGTSIAGTDINVTAHPTAVATGSYNTKLGLSVINLPDDIDVPLINIEYNRISLETLFDNTDLVFNDVCDLGTGRVQQSKLLQRLNEVHNFSLECGLTHVDLSGTPHLNAPNDNIAFTGHVPFNAADQPYNHWPLEIDGQDLRQHNTFELTGTYPETVDGRPALRVGLGNYLRTDNLHIGSGPWSVTLWYYPLSFINYTHLFTAEPLQGTFAIKASYDSGRLYFHTVGTGSRLSSGTLTLNTWQHVSCCYDGQGRLRMYLNGVQILDVTFTPLDITPSTFVIGQYGLGQEHGEGYQSGHRLYRYELSPTEVLYLATNT